MANSIRVYRILCWVGALSTAVATTGWILGNQRLHRSMQAMAAHQCPLDPELLSRLRDQNFEFVIRNYEFEYEGQSGDLIDDSILCYGLWEKDVAFFMRDYLERRGNENAVFIDVGCNAGHHSLFLSRHVKQIHAFDPYLPAVERFRKMIARNRFTNIIVHPVGLGAKEEELPFFEPSTSNIGTGSFRDRGGHQTFAKSGLRIVRGDDWLDASQVSDVELLKIDIEGFEEPALLGLRRTLESHRPVVIVEVTRPPGGTIASMGQLQSLFPKEYRFLAFMAEDTTPLTGRYLLQGFESLADAFFRDGIQVNLVGYPRERTAEVPREPRSRGRPRLGMKIES